MSIQIKPKPCKGSGKAKGYGCGSMQYERVYGLGKKCGCYQKWLLESPEGNEKLTKSAIQASKKAKKQKVKENRVAKINYAGKLQEKVQEIARLVDMGHPCPVKKKLVQAYHGGHVFSKGAHPECKYNLHNIFAQDADSNSSTQDDIKMRDGIEKIFGKDYYNFISSLTNKEAPKYLKVELEPMYKRACKIALELKKEGKFHTLEERITVRNAINLKIGYYNKDRCVFQSS